MVGLFVERAGSFNCFCQAPPKQQQTFFCGIWIGSGLSIVSNITDQDRIWTESIEKKFGIFVVKSLFFVHFKIFLENGWAWTVSKIQDWVWIAKCDNPLVFANQRFLKKPSSPTNAIQLSNT